jgi:hypothetical protein
MLKLNTNYSFHWIQTTVQRQCQMFCECCSLSVLFIACSYENGWKSYGNNCYLFVNTRLNWHDAKVYKIVINTKIKGILYIYLLSVKILLSREESWDPINPYICCACPTPEGKISIVLWQGFLMCCVFVFCFFFVLCTLCCQFLWIVHFWLPLRYSLMFI